jgi:hypothetical protein
LTADANAWSTAVVWGAKKAPGGDHISWGSEFEAGQNVVWGTQCGGGDCRTAWSVPGSGGAVLGAADGDTVVWGTSDGDTVVWGTSCQDPSCEPVLWNRP